jgi:hypothetical protein
VTAFAANATDLVLDINGYFVTPDLAAAGALVYYPLTPCRVIDSRIASSVQLGGPFLFGSSTRTFPLLQSNCGIPPTAKAYALNFTAVPGGPLGYLTVWPSGEPQPLVSTLNSPTGTVVANMAIVPVGDLGAINTFVTDAMDLVVDINGYFAPAGAPGELTFQTVTPCRVLDTRNAQGPLGGPDMSASQTRSYPVASSACGLPQSASAYSLNATVVPQAGTLGYLSLWPAGQSVPLVSTLNSIDGSVVSNAALIPAGSNGDVNAFVTNNTSLIFDANGYFQTPSTFSVLGTPVPLTPANGSVRNNFPRTTTLTWSSVSGASQYGVEIQFCQSADFSDCRDLLITTTQAAAYTFDFVGAQPGRWRVWAIDGATGRASSVSSWFTFSYTL